MEEFYQLYLNDIVNSRSENTYGLALANLTLGVVRKDPIHIVMTRSFFAAHREISRDPKEKRLSSLGVKYAERILSGRYDEGVGTKEAVKPIKLSKHVPPATDFRRIVIGGSVIRVKRRATIKTQVDRVTRDWLLGRNIKSPPWAFSKENAVPWHEGKKITEIVELTGARVLPVWGTTARKFGESWFAPDADGVFRFELSEDKVYNFPTTIVIDDHTAVINDTHGISAIAWDSLDADLVIGCGDHAGKIEAAYYLADKGVDVYVPTDRFLSMLIGTRTKGVIVGSAPIRKAADGAAIGDQAVAIDANEAIVVSTAKGRYPLQYYDTPYRYFKALGEYAGKALNITAVEVKQYGRADVVVDEARRIGAKVIGIRVKSKNEHDAVYSWLKEDRTRRAVLFHSAVYPDGYQLFFEFPRQTSFGDIYPRFE